MLFTTDRTELAIKSKLFRGFGDSSRLSILDALRNGPLTVAKIVETTGLSQSNTSNHLGCLRDCGLVVAEQNGDTPRRAVAKPFHALQKRLFSDLGPPDLGRVVLVEGLLADERRVVGAGFRVHEVAEQDEVRAPAPKFSRRAVAVMEPCDL